jgi:tetratricopeptide (TPR) repeat protein
MKLSIMADARRLLLLVILIWHSATFAQSLDSLNMVLRDSRNLSEEDIAKINLEVARYYAQRSDFHNCLVSLDKVSRMTRDSAVMARAYRVKAQVYATLDQFENVVPAVQKALNYLPKHHDPIELIKCYNLIGNVASFTGKYRESFQYHYQSLVLCERFHAAYEKAIETMNLGLVYYKVYDYEMAEKYLTLSLQLCTDETCRYQVLSNLALSVCHLNEPERALAYLKDLSVFNDGNISEKDQMSMLYTMGVALHKLGNLDSAMQIFVQSLRLSESLSNLRFEAENSLSLAEIYLVKGNYQKASFFLNRAEEISTSNSFEDIVLRIFKQKILLSIASADLVKKILAQRQYIGKKADLYNTVLAQIIWRRKAAFLENEYQAAIKSYALILDEKQKQEQVEKLLSTIEHVLCIFLGLTVILLLNSIRTVLWNRLSLEKLIDGRTKMASAKVNELTELIQNGYGLLSNVSNSIGHNRQFCKLK